MAHIQVRLILTTEITPEIANELDCPLETKFCRFSCMPHPPVIGMKILMYGSDKPLVVEEVIWQQGTDFFTIHLSKPDLASSLWINNNYEGLGLKHL